jgi:hypothetical protein
LSDACAVLEAGWVIDRIGETLDGCCVSENNGQQVRAPWEKIEACVHVLTAVAPKAAAGQDRVIPMVLNLLPKLVYPSAGSSGLLLRAAAGRMVTYTAGYLRFELDLCVALLSFFALDLVPALSRISWQRQTGELDLLVFSQNAACGAIRAVLTAAKSGLAQKVPLAQLFSALAQLVVDEKIAVDARTQVIQGLGGLLVELRDWNAIRAGLFELVDKTALAANLVLTNATPPAGGVASSAPGPAAVKIYFSALAAITHLPRHSAAGAKGDEGAAAGGFSEDDSDDDFEGGGSSALSGVKHPVLDTLGHFMPLTSALLLGVAVQWGDLTSHACTSLLSVFVHNRDASANSPLLLGTLQTLLQCFQRVPSSAYMHYVRLTITHFGELTRVHVELVRLLSELAGAFTRHATLLLSRNTALSSLTFDEARMVQETFAVLSEVLRYVDLVAFVTGQCDYFPGVLLVAARCLRDCVVDAQTLAGVAGLLHFCERVMTWIDPPRIMHAQEDTERVSKQVSAYTRNLLLANGNRDEREALLLFELVDALCAVWTEKSAEFPQILGSVGVSLRLALSSSLGPSVSARLRAAAELWTALLGSSDKARELLSAMEANCKNSRVFGKIVGEAARDFNEGRRRRKFQ